MKGIVYDIEVFPNFFCLNAKKLNENKWFRFKLDEFKTLSEIRVLDSFLRQKKIWIAFNQLHYDNVILNYILHNYQKNLDKNPLEFLSEIKQFNDLVIEDYYNEIKQYKYSNTHFKGINIDLFLYWSKGLRISKKISLKALGIGLKHHKLQELPYPPDKDLSYLEMDEVFKYCDNDVIITEKLFNNLYDTSNTKTGSVKLRYDVYKQTGLNCFSWDTPKIASESLLQAYCKKTGYDIKEVRNYRFERPDIIKIGDLFYDINIEFETEQLQKIWNKIKNSINSVSEEFVFTCNETILKISIANGGIHSVNKNEKYFETEDNYLITSDVSSLYPTNIIGANTIRFPEVLQTYIQTKVERLIAKKEGNKAVDKFKKLILNSVSGLLDSQYSWLYYPEGALKLRLLGQLQLLTLIEKTALQIPDCKVISCNTDGIEVLLPKNKLDDYFAIVKQVEHQFNIEFEHEKYKAIYYLSVNDYIAILDNGKTKKKGSFLTEPELGDSCDFLVIPKAIEAYLVHKQDYKEFIYNHINSSPNAIYDYCMSPKVDKSYKVIYKGQKLHQKLNRFYPTLDKTEGYIFKYRDGSNHHLLKDSPVTLFNDYVEGPYDINYNYFITKVSEIIDYFEPKQLTLF